MLAQNKIAGFLAKVKKQTEAGAMAWQREEATEQEFEAEETLEGYAYTTKMGSQYLRIAKINYKYWHDEETWDLQSLIVLDFVGFDGRMLWRFPSTPEISELFNVVRFSNSGVEQAIDQFLKD